MKKKKKKMKKKFLTHSIGQKYYHGNLHKKLDFASKND